MNASRCLLAASVTCLLTSCMIHTSEPPRVAMPSEWTVGLVSTKEQDLGLYPWWRDLSSPELDQLVDEGLKNNRQIQLAIANVAQAQAQLDTVKLGWLPSLNFLGGTISGNTTLFFQGLPLPVANVGGFVGFLPTYIVNLFQQPVKQMQAGQMLDASRADYLAVRTAIIAQITSAYMTVLSSQKQGDILIDMRGALSERAEIGQAMAAKGLNTRYQQNQLEAEQLLIEGQLAQNRANQAAAKNALLILVGRDIGQIRTQSVFDQINTQVPAPGNQPAAVIAIRPDVAAARARLNASNYGVSASAALLMPSISLNALMTNIKATNNGIDSSANANFQAAYANWLLNPEVIGLISASNARYQSALINYVDVVNNALRETDDALSAYNGLQTKLQHDTAAYKKATENMAISKSMHKQGLISKSQYLENQVQYQLVTAAITQTKLAELIALAKLYQCMGGGALHEESNLSISDGKIREITKSPEDS